MRQLNRRQAVTVSGYTIDEPKPGTPTKYGTRCVKFNTCFKIAKDKDRHKVKHVKDFWNTNIGIMKDNISAIESIDPGDNFRNHLIASKCNGGCAGKTCIAIRYMVRLLQFRIEILAEFDGRVQRVFERIIC